MNDEQMDDLKQFIAAAISQTEKRLESEIAELRSEMNDIRSEMADGFAGIGEAIENIHSQSDEHNNEVNERLTKLEHQTA